MAANEFIVKLKADGSNKDQCDIEKVHGEYNTISKKLTAKDRGTFALNVLCIFCRNLEKVPSWGDKVDNKALLMLSIDCVRGTRELEKADCVKTLACVYHIHRYFVRKNTPIPPELVLKLSYMPYENDILLDEYSKTYWSIIADRLHYIEKLKQKLFIAKLLPKLAEHITRTLFIYNNVQFCTNILSNVIKKLNHLYNDSPKELNQIYGNIFDSLMKTDLKSFKKLNETDSTDLYVKFNDCLYYIAENASRIKFKDSALNSAVRSCIMILGYRSDMFHCFQTFYSNTFCSILTANSDAQYMETILNSFITSCETTEKLGYKTTMQALYPFLNQLLRLYVENFNDMFSEALQEKCLDIILFLMEKLKTTDQLWRCDNCKIKTGLHDGLRLSLLIKLFINNKANADSSMQIFYAIVKEQYVVLNELKALGCGNYINYYKKIQTDVHNLAVKLNGTQNYKYSIELLDLYLKNEFENSNGSDTKNICRALYNKSICETDLKLYEKALIDAFLSQIFAKNEGLSNDKYISLVMDIKAKALKDKDVGDNALQLMSILEACKTVIESNYYGNLKPLLSNLKYSILLKHEFSTYAKMWPAMVPIAGVWISLNDISKQKYVSWLNCENEDEVLNTLYDIILQTPKAVRTLHNEHFNKIITELLERFEDVPANTTDLRVVHATLLFMKAEFDLADASLKYNWKIKEPNIDPKSVSTTRTIPQEHTACQKALEAVEIWTLLVKELDTVKNTSNLSLSLQMSQLFVYQLLYLYKTVHGLQLAYLCCQIAKYIGDKEAYITNAGTILYYMSEGNDSLNDIIPLASKWAAELLDNLVTIQSALVFICDIAIFYSKCGSIAKLTKLVQTAQSRILAAYDKHPDVQLDLAVGRLLEAQAVLNQRELSTLTVLINTQKHYISMSNTASNYLPRRTLSLRIKLHLCTSSASVCSLCRGLRLWSRGTSACLCALPAASAHAHGTLYAANTNTAYTDDAQVKIYNSLKYILGLHPTNEIDSNIKLTESNIKKQLFTPKQDVETMLENLVLKKAESSPSLICAEVPAFTTPAFFNHDEKCDCYACENPLCIILAGKMCGLESSMYFRMKEFDIAKNYFVGTLECFSYIDIKLRSIFKKFSDCNFEDFLINSVENKMASEFGRVKLEIMIEAAFLELSQKNYSTADDYVVMIHEIVQDLGDVDMYVRNDIMNLMITSALLRKVVKLPDIEDLETEFESLKLSPNVEPPSTPINKVPPPKSTNIIIKDEEIPKLKRKAIKLNLDEAITDKEVAEDKDAEFKIPVPVTSKPVLENITPRPSRLKSRADKTIDKSKPQIIVTQPSVEMSTPKTKILNEFFTPAKTPEQFFTPQTSVKTYTKKSLRHNIVKNLESEFSTPIDKENSTLKHAGQGSKSRGNLKVKALKRATSPGKLERENTTKTRSRRLRQPVQFSLDDDGK